jgi:hypothetical protein
VAISGAPNFCPLRAQLGLPVAPADHRRPLFMVVELLIASVGVRFEVKLPCGTSGPQRFVAYYI